MSSCISTTEYDASIHFHLFKAHTFLRFSPSRGTRKYLWESISRARLSCYCVSDCNRSLRLYGIIDVNDTLNDTVHSSVSGHTRMLSQFGLFIVSTSPLHRNPCSKSFPFIDVFQLRSFDHTILKVVFTILASLSRTAGSTPEMVSCPRPPNRVDSLPMITGIRSLTDHRFIYPRFILWNNEHRHPPTVNWKSSLWNGEPHHDTAKQKRFHQRPGKTGETVHGTARTTGKNGTRSSDRGCLNRDLATTNWGVALFAKKKPPSEARDRRVTGKRFERVLIVTEMASTRRTSAKLKHRAQMSRGQHSEEGGVRHVRLQPFSAQEVGRCPSGDNPESSRDHHPLNIEDSPRFGAPSARGESEQDEI